MADYAPIIPTPRKFPSGCGPSAPKTGAAFRWIYQPPPPQQPAKKPQEPQIGGNTKREGVAEALDMFRSRCREIEASNPGIARVDMSAYTELKRKLRVGNAKSLGPVPGVEVGEEFKYRAELVIAGVHSHLQQGIDFAFLNGRIVATCVVATEGYSDDMQDPNFLEYEGEGGFSAKFSRDQEMKGGNLALKNSREVRNEVRVVRGVKVKGQRRGIVYVYDGLYEVVGCRNKTGRKGSQVYVFDLTRKPGQKVIDWKRI